MMQVAVPAKVRRGPVLYARLKTENHAWIQAEAKTAGYDSVSEYTDALFDTLRGGSSVSSAKMSAKKSSPKKSATTAAKKKNARSKKTIVS